MTQAEVRPLLASIVRLLDRANLLKVGRQPLVATLSTFSTTCSCAVLRYLTDPARGIAVPVAVLLWDRESGHVRFRLP